MIVGHSRARPNKKSFEETVTNAVTVLTKAMVARQLKY